MNTITKIVITGGPCAGKTSVMENIKENFSKKGYTVLFISESATELISKNIAPWTLKTPYDYQLCQMRLQLAKEEVYQKAAEDFIDNDKILIVCDRGMLDNRAYMTDGEFLKALDFFDLKEENLIKEYDAVFHLETAAKGNAKSYTLSNNETRTETPDVAISLDDKTLDAWKNHPYRKVIPSYDDFNEKIKKCIDEISVFLDTKR